ncbi:IS110 family RNA-guided transposase [Tellurirhabdus rosea]|uniref:IS110 family transposase n=1 Tax=Tellurirhabdus rosea TaxID=2674997 RepID=UPI0022556DB8|nr:IS110 family transposase [Tellurirhabdus rosea]
MKATASFLRYGVGFDIGKDTILVCVSVIDTTGKVTVKGTTKLANKAAAFSGLMTWLGKHCKQTDLPVRYVMEATGVYHETLAWYLFTKDQSVSVVLPNKAKHYLKSLGLKSKNDRIDAQGLARMTLEQQLPLWQPLSKNIYSLRMLTRQHQRLQELKTQSQNQKHSIEYSQFSDGFILKQLNNLIALYDRQLTEISQAINDLLDDDQPLREGIDRLSAIKGLGRLSAATLVAETNGFTGFENVRQLVSFAGYDVVENQSGKHIGKTRISKKGNSRIRRILHLPALNAVRFGEPGCAALYERVYSRSRIKMKAYVAVQKKLLTLCYALWRNGSEYEPSYSPTTTKNVSDQAKKIVPTSGTTQDQEAEACLSYR